jgi:cystathionine beta-lyase family protein involved in aluminum resistance
LKLNFGSIQWEMEGFKRKVMTTGRTEIKEEVKNIWSGVNLEEYYNDYLQGGSKMTNVQ